VHDEHKVKEKKKGKKATTKKATTKKATTKKVPARSGGVHDEHKKRPTGQSRT